MIVKEEVRVKDLKQTKEQLMIEVDVLRKRIAELESLEDKCLQLSEQNNLLVNVLAQDIPNCKQTEKAPMDDNLVIEQQRSYSVLDRLPALVYLIDPDYSIRFSNRFFQERFGDPKGNPCYKVLAGRTDPCEYCPPFETCKTKKPQLWQWISPDEQTYQFYDYPFMDMDNSKMVLKFGIDITDQKRAESHLQEERNLNAALLDTAGDLIVVCDQDGRIVRFNQICEQITGYTFNEMKDRYIWEVVTAPEDVEHTKSLFNKKSVNWDSPGLKLKLNTHWVTKNGKYRLISWIFTFLFNEKGSNLCYWYRN